MTNRPAKRKGKTKRYRASADSFSVSTKAESDFDEACRVLGWNQPDAAAIERLKHVDLGQAKRYLEEARRTNEPLRVKVDAFRKTLENARLPSEEKAFARSLSKYLLAIQRGEMGHFVKTSTAATTAIEALEGLEHFRASDANLYSEVRMFLGPAQGILEKAIDHCKFQWSGVCVSYARLKVAVMSKR